MNFVAGRKSVNRVLMRLKYNPNHAPAGGPHGGEFTSGRASGGGGSHIVERGPNGFGVVVTHPDGLTSYAGVHEHDWQTWAYESSTIQAAMNGELKEGGSDNSGDILTKSSIKDYQRIGDQIQLAASSNAVSAKMLFRGESYNSDAEFHAAYAVRNKKVENPSLVAATTDPLVAHDYSHSDASGPVKVLVIYHNPNGIKGIQTCPLGVPGNEVVLPKGDKYLVSRVMKRDDGIWQVDKYTAEKHKLKPINSDKPDS